MPEEGAERALKCKICPKEAVAGDYCPLHEKAYHNILGRFETWKTALNLSWEDYLTAIVHNRFSGTKVIEVAHTLLSDLRSGNSISELADDRD
jgi:hypothetical protein